MSSSNFVLSVDLGGTNLRIAAVREDGTVLDRLEEASEARAGSATVLRKVVDAVRSLGGNVESRNGKILGVSLGFPGIVDPAKGIVYRSPHFPDWKDLELLSFFRPELSWPVAVDNDANLAALGESWKGAGRGLKNFLMMTLGTGLGGGMVIDGRVFHGDRGFAGEFGHICIETNGPECACGSRGCLETFVSATGILRLAEISDQADGREQLLERLGKPLARTTAKDLYVAALDGDIFANTLFKKMGYYLGIGLASLVNTLGMETIIVGGGVAEAWDFFIEPAKKELAQRTYEETARTVKIVKAGLGTDAALIGGARVFSTSSAG
ncbi:MAG TPA: ROK family protein [bacterium]|nr:ROK family protein [bacterium]